MAWVVPLFIVLLAASQAAGVHLKGQDECHEECTSPDYCGAYARSLMAREQKLLERGECNKERDEAMRKWREEQAKQAMLGEEEAAQIEKQHEDALVCQEEHKERAEAKDEMVELHEQCEVLKQLATHKRETCEKKVAHAELNAERKAQADREALQNAIDVHEEQLKKAEEKMKELEYYNKVAAEARAKAAKCSCGPCVPDVSSPLGDSSPEDNEITSVRDRILSELEHDRSELGLIDERLKARMDDLATERAACKDLTKNPCKELFDQFKRDHHLPTDGESSLDGKKKKTGEEEEEMPENWYKPTTFIPPGGSHTDTHPTIYPSEETPRDDLEGPRVIVIRENSTTSNVTTTGSVRQQYNPPSPSPSVNTTALGEEKPVTVEEVVVEAPRQPPEEEEEEEEGIIEKMPMEKMPMEEKEWPEEEPHEKEWPQEEPHEKMPMEEPHEKEWPQEEPHEKMPMEEPHEKEWPQEEPHEKMPMEEPHEKEWPQEEPREKMPMEEPRETEWPQEEPREKMPMEEPRETEWPQEEPREKMPMEEPRETEWPQEEPREKMPMEEPYEEPQPRERVPAL